MPARLPNFLHLGPGKSGSTWLHEVLITHPEVFLTEAKDLYFFSRYYERGSDWYAAQFDAATDRQRIVGEICPDYLVAPKAPRRMAETLGSTVSLMVTLRDPVARAFSSYLYLRKHGLAGETFRETMERTPELIEEGRYATLLGRYLTYFPKERFHVATFDQLQADPQAFVDAVTHWLQIAPLELDAELQQPRLPASAARFQPLASLVQRGANWIREHDGANVVGRVKRSALVQRALYRPLGDAGPCVSDEDARFVRATLADEMAAVEAMFDVPLTELWGWP